MSIIRLSFQQTNSRKNVSLAWFNQDLFFHIECVGAKNITISIKLSLKFLSIKKGLFWLFLTSIILTPII